MNEKNVEIYEETKGKKMVENLRKIKKELE
jgi:hypothetical protein